MRANSQTDLGRLYGVYSQLLFLPPNDHGHDQFIHQNMLRNYLGAAFNADESMRYLWHLPADICRVALKYMKFYIDIFEPCLRTLSHAKASSPMTRSEVPALVHESICSAYLIVLSSLGADPEKSLYRRAQAGLLRQEQVRLVALAVERVVERLDPVCGLQFQFSTVKSLDSIRKCAELGELDMSKVDELLRKLWEEVQWAYGLISGFLTEERFRSKRLELLLLRYLDEDCGDSGSKVAEDLEVMNARMGSGFRQRPGRLKP
ncbi:hypothetical protein BJ508DRAFT_411844 [Ascobolus immersus RN42]|uniref:Uncharacterized protein n=1 Tax=Ascobolus immersus RN42 TaxID=1160509 RepID=A0A3N4IW71_ASCIM|nr:hypothetical protein BJ508DRAFT_411844 [Ascobolus immersus RN42]